jgi:RNA polymerase sigma factor (sigma-70 family)
MTETQERIINAAVRRYLKHCPDALMYDDKEDLKNEAWILLQGVENEYDHDRSPGDFTRFAVQRLAWRLLDLARTKSWAPRSVPVEDRRRQIHTSILRPRYKHDRDANNPEYILYDHNGHVGENPLRELIEEDSFANLVNRLKRVLPRGYQDAFVLYHVKDFKLREVAEILGITESRVSQQISRARDILQERFPDVEELISS